MAYEGKLPPGVGGTAPLGRLSLHEKTGDAGDDGDEMAAAKPATAGPAGRHDPYEKALERSLRELDRSDYPAGMIPWLADANPALYARLTVGLPDELQRLWSRHAPLEDFDGILGLWLEAHRTACELFNVARASNQARHVTEKHRG